MKRLATWIACAGMLAGPALAAEEPSPYAGLESRPIKALSEEEIEGYLEGRGMGFAMAAELNDYPGPKHVLELADRLSLTSEQARGARLLFEEMKAEAVDLGARLVAKEREIDALFAAGTADEASLEAAVGEAARLRGALRYAHLRAHLGMKALLTEEQVRSYGRLRGYGEPSGGEPHQHKHGGHGR